jgi:glycosyltransferase involved in cell wall biosynthesis
VLHKLPSLDLFRQPDPFRIPKRSEFRSWADVWEFLTMCTGGFAEPRTFGMRLERALRHHLGDFDVLHDNQSLSWSIRRLARAGLPVLASIHHPITVDRRLGIEAATTVTQQFGIRRFYGFLRMQTAVARSLPAVMTVSEASRRDIVREMGVRDDRIVVVPVGVDTDIFRPLPEVAREDDLLVTTASADVPLKGLRYLVEAVIRSHRRGSARPRLMIVGQPKPNSEVREMVAREGFDDWIQFAGTLAQEDLVHLYARATAAVVPSLYEGFSLPAIEAMAMGTPLIATNGGALAEVAGEDGEFARVVPAGDAAALSAAIDDVLSDREAAMVRAKRARAMVSERLTWAAAAEATEAHYYELLARQGKGGGGGRAT